MTTQQQQHELAASAVQGKRRELEQRLKEVSEAPPFAKALPMRLTAAAFFELLDHQAAFNQHTIARLAAADECSQALTAVLRYLYDGKAEDGLQTRLDEIEQLLDSVIEGLRAGGALKVQTLEERRANGS